MGCLGDFVPDDPFSNDFQFAFDGSNAVVNLVNPLGDFLDVVAEF